MKSIRRSSEGYVVIPEQKQVRFFHPGESPQDLPNALRAVRCASKEELPGAVAKAQAIANRHAIEPYVPPTNDYPGEDASAMELFQYWTGRAMSCKTVEEFQEVRVNSDKYFELTLKELGV